MSIVLETERLLLREWTMADAEALFEICRDAEVMKYLGTGQPYREISEAIKFLDWAVEYRKQNGFCRWAVIEKASGRVVGSCGFAYPHETPEVELGYLFARGAWGRGFATEAAGACLDYGFGKLKFREIIAITDLANVASQRVLEKIGFARRGVEKFAGDDALIYIARNLRNNLDE